MLNWVRVNAVSRIYDRTTGKLLWEDLTETGNSYKTSWWIDESDLHDWVRKNIILPSDPVAPPDPTALKALLLEEK